MSSNSVCLVVGVNLLSGHCRVDNDTIEYKIANAATPHKMSVSFAY